MVEYKSAIRTNNNGIINKSVFLEKPFCNALIHLNTIKYFQLTVTHMGVCPTIGVGEYRLIFMAFSIGIKLNFELEYDQSISVWSLAYFYTFDIFSHKINA